MLDCDIPQWLGHIMAFIFVDLCRFPTLFNGYVTCDIHVQGYITMWCSSSVMSYYDVHLGWLMLNCL